MPVAPVHIRAGEPVALWDPLNQRGQNRLRNEHVKEPEKGLTYASLVAKCQEFQGQKGILTNQNLGFNKLSATGNQIKIT